MVSQTLTFWTELTPVQQQAVVREYGALDTWLSMRRFRPSSIAVAWDNQHPCGISVVSHDRVRVASAVVDVATLRHSALHAAQPAELMVELLMHQASALLAEGIGIVLVSGDVSFWAHFGFAPVSLHVETRWVHGNGHRTPEPGTVRVSRLSPDVAELIRGMVLAHANTVEFVDEAVVDEYEWLQLIGRDGQLRAAAQLMPQEDGNMVIQRAMATDDGAAYDLVTALRASVDDVRRLALRLSHNHAVTRMALEQQAISQISTAGSVAVLGGVIDLPLMLESLKPAFRQRVLASSYADWSGGVRVEISDERAMLMVDRGVISVIDGTREASLRLKQVEVGALAQMAFGYRSIGALRRAGMLYCDDTELPLCEVLFAHTSSVLTI